jgi:hypothetical protein
MFGRDGVAVKLFYAARLFTVAKIKVGTHKRRTVAKLHRSSKPVHITIFVEYYSA